MQHDHHLLPAPIGVTRALCALCAYIILPLALPAQDTPGDHIIADGVTLTATGTLYNYWQAINGSVINGISDTVFAPAGNVAVSGVDIGIFGTGLLVAGPGASLSIADNTQIKLGGVTNIISYSVNTTGPGTLTIGDNFHLDYEDNDAYPFNGINVGIPRSTSSGTPGDRMAVIGDNLYVRMNDIALDVAYGSVSLGGSATLISTSSANYVVSVQTGGTAHLGDGATLTGGHGIVARASDTLITGSNVMINTTRNGVAAFGGGAIRLHGGTINMSGAAVTGAVTIDRGPSGNIELHDFNINSPTNAIYVNAVTNPGYSRGSVVLTGGIITSSTLLFLNMQPQAQHGADITITDADLTRAGGVTATLDGTQTATLALNGGSGLHGDITATGTGGGSLALALNNSSLTGDTLAGDHASITLTGSNNATLTGDVTGHDTTTIALNLAASSTLTGKTTVAGAATLTLALDRSAWHMTDNSILTHLALTGGARVHFPDPAQHGGAFHTLTVTGSLTGAGAFAMSADVATGSADRLVIQGSADGAHQIALTPAAGAALPTGNEAPLLLIQAAGGNATFATFTGTLTAGLYNYNLQDGAHLAAANANSGLTAADTTNWYLHRSSLSATADAIISTAAMLGRDWHYTLDALHLRMGEVRVEAASSRLSASPSSEKRQDAASTTGNIWARARAYRLNADGDLTGRPFTQYAYGLTAGADKTLRPATTTDATTLLAGAFLDMGRTDRDFAGDSATGHTDNLSAGLYGTWLSDTDWHADLVLKADRYKHRFDTQTAGAAPRPVTAAYNSTAQGISLELGRRFTRAGDAGGWWLEPTAQAAIAWMHGATYRTTPGNQTLDVTLATARTAQYRAQLRFGRQLRDPRWLPYGKFGVVKTDTAGGEIRVAGESFAPDYDGWRGELGFGASYQLTARAQLYLDYEYTKSAHYELPWILHLGYRILW